jgi:uncharacterized membrane protein YfcA
MSHAISLTHWQWALALVGAFLVGMSKTGISGLGLIFVGLFATAFSSSKESTGVVLPLLIFGDIAAVASYRAHAQWRHLWRLIPATAFGVVIGYGLFSRISDHDSRVLIGAIIVALACLSYWLRFHLSKSGELSDRLHPALTLSAGVLAGVITLIANAAGPVMAIYLVSMRLPKLQNLGTSAVFFLLINLFKLPFIANLGLVTQSSLAVNLELLPAVLAGAVAGRWLLAFVNQNLFENLVLVLTLASGILMLL